MAGVRDEDLNAMMLQGKVEFTLELIDGIVRDLLTEEDEEALTRYCQLVAKDPRTAAIVIKYLVFIARGEL